MEYASWLAGERWSDHPPCTHPLLAGVARLVNDHISDGARTRLVGMIPQVVGLNGDDPLLDVTIVIRCASAAIPVAAESRQRALAVSLLASKEILTGLDGTDRDQLMDRADRALARAPHAARWAESFTALHDITLEAFRARTAPATVRVAVVGIAEASVPDADDRLYRLLNEVIDHCRERLQPVSSTEPDPMRSVATGV